MTEVKPVERPDPPQHGDERTVLNGILDFLRGAIVNKVAGLDLMREAIDGLRGE
jgi:hypothetical protein